MRVRALARRRQALGPTAAAAWASEGGRGQQPAGLQGALMSTAAPASIIPSWTGSAAHGSACQCMGNPGRGPSAQQEPSAAWTGLDWTGCAGLRAARAPAHSAHSTAAALPQHACMRAVHAVAERARTILSAGGDSQAPLACRCTELPPERTTDRLCSFLSTCRARSCSAPSSALAARAASADAASSVILIGTCNVTWTCLSSSADAGHGGSIPFQPGLADRPPLLPAQHGPLTLTKSAGLGWTRLKTPGGGPG